MTFLSPQWFLLIPVLLLVGWLRPTWGLHRPWRMIVLVTLVLALVRPTFEKLSSGLDLWVLVDRSASINEVTEPQIEEWRSLLERSKPSSNDALHFLHYASEVTEGDEFADEITNRNSLTNTKLALLHAASLQSSERQGRVLLFSDGYSTGEVASTLNVLSEASIPLDLRILGQGGTRDVRVSDFTLSSQVKVREPFLISAQLSGPSGTAASVQLFRDGALLKTKEVTLTDNGVTVEWIDRLGQNGSYDYRVNCLVPDDPIPGNNTSTRWVQVSGGAEVLLLSPYKNDPLAQALRKQATSVDHLTEFSALSAGRLSGYRAVIINNVPSHSIPKDFIEALPFFVKEQGGGLAMIGGKEAFGAGGYYQSSIDSLLPVSLESKDEHRKLSVAMAVVMDRSGSMGMTVAGGQTKMQLANSGTATALGLLGARDEIAVLPVDSEPFRAVALTQVGNKKEALTQKIMNIKSSGGGIYVYNGLKAGWAELKGAQAGTKHLILFSDAMDTEQPAQYKALLKEITEAGASVSVIGLGKDFDDDADLLKDIAARGNGRMFFTDEPKDLPHLFAQETVTIARSTFIEDLTIGVPTGNWVEVSPAAVKWLPQVGGYNLCYLRKGASASLVSKDEYLAPLVAHAPQGLGRTMAVTFPMGGEFSSQARQWEEYGTFIHTFTRWLIGESTPAGIALRTEQEGTSYFLDLHYDVAQWGEKLSLNPPKVRTRFLHSDQVFTQEWRRISPGLYQSRLELQPDQPMQGIVKVGAHTLPFGPMGTTQSAEWDFSEGKRQALRNLSYQSGGELLLDLKNAWDVPPQPIQQTILLPFLVLAVLCLLLDALLTRTGWSVIPLLRAGEKKVRVKELKETPRKKVFKKGGRKPQKKRNLDTEKPVVVSSKGQESNSPPAGTKSSDMRSRLKRAKERR